MARPNRERLVYTAGEFRVIQRNKGCFVLWRVGESSLLRRAGAVASTQEEAKAIADELHRGRA